MHTACLSSASATSAARSFVGILFFFFLFLILAILVVFVLFVFLSLLFQILSFFFISATCTVLFSGTAAAASAASGVNRRQRPAAETDQSSNGQAGEQPFQFFLIHRNLLIRLDNRHQGHPFAGHCLVEKK